jgi:hypothetical protein
MRRIVDLIHKYPGSALVGLDFPFGYPFNSSMGGGREAAHTISELLFSTSTDANNRFDAAALLNLRISGKEGPFWGCPTAFKSDSLTTTKPPFKHTKFQEWRLVEQFLRSKNHRIMNVWQLLGQGSVGSQTLTGLKALYDLCLEVGFTKPVKFWPFETDWDENLDGIILTEVWPSLNSLSDFPHQVKDARQVLACRDWVRLHDNQNSLTELFRAPDWLSAGDRSKCLQEEGWILGVR